MPAGAAQVLWIVLAPLSLYAWAYVSERQPDTDMNRRYAWTLLALASSLRLGARTLRFDAPLTARLDAYALATLGGLDTHGEPGSALWQSLLFAMSLQAERVLQRLAGLGLQALCAAHP